MERSDCVLLRLLGRGLVVCWLIVVMSVVFCDEKGGESSWEYTHSNTSKRSCDLRPSFILPLTRYIPYGY